MTLEQLSILETWQIISLLQRSPGVRVTVKEPEHDHIKLLKISRSSQHIATDWELVLHRRMVNKKSILIHINQDKYFDSQRERHDVFFKAMGCTPTNANPDVMHYDYMAECRVDLRCLLDIALKVLYEFQRECIENLIPDRSHDSEIEIPGPEDVEQPADIGSA